MMGNNGNDDDDFVMTMINFDNCIWQLRSISLSLS